MSDHTEWPEVLIYSQNAILSSSPLERETGLSLLGLLASSYIEILLADVHNVLAVFQRSLLDDSNEGKVMLAASKALFSVLDALPQESDYEKFRGIVGATMNGMQIALDRLLADQWVEATAITYAESLVDMADVCAPFFGEQLSHVLTCGLQLAERPNVPSSVRHMLVEFLVSICSSLYKSIRKVKGPEGGKGFFAVRFFSICARLMVVLKDDPQWEAASTLEEEDAVDDEDWQDSEVGEQAADRVTQALGLRSTFAPISAQLHSLLYSPQWQHQRAGLIMMGNYLEVTSRIPDKAQLAQHRSETVLALSNFVCTRHPRVRSAAFYSISLLFISHGRDLPARMSEQLLEVVLSGMPQVNNPAARVRRKAVAALMNLINYTSATLLEGWTPRLLGAITGALVEGPLLVQEACVSCIIALAESVKGAQLAAHYDNIMPILKQLLAHARAGQLGVLWGRTLECCAVVGEASGREKFRADAMDMMTSMQAMQQTDIADETTDAQKYLLRAWVGIARCLGSEFVPFLPLVMTRLMAAISQDLSAGTGDIDLDDIDQRSDVELIEADDGSWMAVRTSAVEEQAKACQLVTLLAEKLQEHFFPFVEQSIRCMAPLVSSPHEDVRSYCFVALPEFVRATGKATAPSRTELGTVSEYSIGLLITAVEKEGVLELIMTALQALKLVLSYTSQDWSVWAQKTAGVAGQVDPFGEKSIEEPPSPVPATSVRFLNAEQMVTLTQSAKVVLRDSLQRRAVLRAEAACGAGAGAGSAGRDDDDAADETMFMQDSMELHYNVAELIGAILRTHGDAFMPVYLEHWHETMTEMSHPYCLKEDRNIAFFVISDVIEFGLTPSTAEAYLAGVVPVLCEACATVEDAGTRQPCAYALGRASALYPQAFAAHAMTALQALGACIALGEEPDEPRGSCTDNAAASVGIILENLEQQGGAGAGLNFEFMWGQWLGYLPLKHDEDEAGKVLVQLSRLVAQRHDTLLARGTRLSQAVSVLLQGVGSDPSTTTAVTREIALAIHTLRASAGANADDLFRSISNDVGPELSARLSAVLGAPVGAGAGAGHGGASSPLATAPIQDVLLRR